MFVKRCAWCGEPFEAQRSTAKYCSSSCRGNGNRHPDQTLDADPGLNVGESDLKRVSFAIGEARRLASTLGALSVTAPLQLRAGCARISRAIAEAIEKEGW